MWPTPATRAIAGRILPHAPALEDDPVRVQNLQLRSGLMIEIAERIKDQGLAQSQAAEVLRIAQPWVSALMNGKINDFRLDSLVDLAHRLAMHLPIKRRSVSRSR